MSLNKIHVSLVTKVIFTFVISLAFMGISASADYNGPFYNDGNTPFVYDLNDAKTATAAMTLTDGKDINSANKGFPTKYGEEKDLPINYKKWQDGGYTKLYANLDIENNSSIAGQPVNDELRLDGLKYQDGVYIENSDKDYVLNQLKNWLENKQVQKIDFYTGAHGENDTIMNATDSENTINKNLENLKNTDWNTEGFAIHLATPDGGEGSPLQAKKGFLVQIPLIVTDAKVADAQTANGADFTMTQYNDVGEQKNETTLHPKFAEEIDKSTVNSKPYLVTEQKNGTYSQLPSNVQNLVPTAKNNQIIFDPFEDSYTKVSQEQDNIQPFNGIGEYYVNTKPIFDQVSKDGWSIEYKGDKKNNVMFPYYTYDWNNSSQPKVVGLDGKPFTKEEYAKYATYVALRKVLDAKDWTMKAGETVDPSKGFESWTNSTGTIKDFAEAKNAHLTVDTSAVKNQQAGTYPVTYTVPDAKFDGETTVQNVSKTAYVTVTGNGGGSNSTSGSSSTGSTTNTNPNTGSNSTSNSNNNSTSSSSSSTSNNGSNTTSVTTGAHVNTKGTAVYATKKIGLYKKADFSRHNRIKWYAKTKRVNRPEFIVKGFKRDNSGKLRYRVQQYNPYTGKYVKGTKGYITASAKYVVSAYYQSVPKSKKIRVINRKGVNSYKKATLTKKVKNYKKGTLLKVKKVIHHKLATRYVLTNGRYITANKKFVIQK